MNFPAPPFPAPISQTHDPRSQTQAQSHPRQQPQLQRPPSLLPPQPPPRSSSAPPTSPQQLAVTSAAAELATQSLLSHQIQLHIQHQQQQHLRQQQQQQQQQQQLLHHQLQQQQSHLMNGVNGGNMAVGGMPGPSPAGHQAELNYIYGMVEELSKQLADNRRVTEDIVNGLGRVRTRARTQAQANDEVISTVAEDINGQEQNLDALISVLSESLEKAKFSRDANATLLTQYAHALDLNLKQFHDYKTKHVDDVASWHRSYRSQLDDARRENSRLREQIWEMQTHAGTANEQLRHFRRKYDEDEDRWQRRVDDRAARQELRFWKRMAMPELEEDDSYWSDDDDVIDPAEKIRLAEVDRRALQEQQGGESPGEEDGVVDEHGELVSAGHHLGSLGLMGGIQMQRDDGGQQMQDQGGGLQLGQAMPMPPARPGSAASSTGSTGP